MDTSLDIQPIERQPVPISRQNAVSGTWEDYIASIDNDMMDTSDD